MLYIIPRLLPNEDRGYKIISMLNSANHIISFADIKMQQLLAYYVIGMIIFVLSFVEQISLNIGILFA